MIASLTASSPAHWKSGIRMILVPASGRRGRGGAAEDGHTGKTKGQVGRHIRRSRMRTCVIAAFGGALALVSPSLSVAAGALAIDENQGDQWGWAVDYSARADADRRAMDECGHGCSIVMRFSNTCAAYAADQFRGSTVYGWASGFSSSSAAQSRALQACQRRGGANSSCIVRVWGCDRPKVGVAFPGSQQPRQTSQSKVRETTASGPSRSTVRQVQELLSRLGYRPGPVDGIAGRRTTAAVKRFQSASGVAVDGHISGALVAKLRAAVDAGKGMSTQPRPEKAQAASKETQAATPAGKAGDLWGSIAYSPTSRLGVIVWNSGGRGAAKQQSLQGCRRDGGIGCKEVAWFRNACGAIAIGSGTGYGGGWGGSKAESERMALSNCRSVAGNCQVEVSRCTDRATETPTVAKAPTEKKPVAVTEPARSVQQSPGTKFRDCPGCPELVVVPSGSYMMGSPSGERDRYDSEGPVHRVEIPERFAVGVYEVTFGEWDACVSGGGCNGHRPDDEGWGGENRPVINVSWEDAKAYVGWLSGKTGEGYRLLSESEWEYVARAGTTTMYHFRSSISSGEANYYESGHGKTVPVGSYPSNAFGLHDVHGNVWEWVEDCWHGDYRGAPSDGSAWVTDCDSDIRVLRGGSWYLKPRSLRSAFRNWGTSGDRISLIGFRVARTLD